MLLLIFKYLFSVDTGKMSVNSFVIVPQIISHPLLPFSEILQNLYFKFTADNFSTAHNLWGGGE